MNTTGINRKHYTVYDEKIGGETDTYGPGERNGKRERML